MVLTIALVDIKQRHTLYFLYSLAWITWLLIVQKLHTSSACDPN